MKNTDWSCKGLVFSSQHSPGISLLSITQDPESPLLSSGLHRYQAQMWYTDTHAGKYTPKIKINIKKEKQKGWVSAGF